MSDHSDSQEAVPPTTNKYDSHVLTLLNGTSLPAIIDDASRIYKIEGIYGKSLKMQIPLWFEYPRMFYYANFNKNRTLIYISGVHSVEGIDIALIWSPTEDRRGLTSIITYENVMAYCCDVNWFTKNSLAMYYTNFPGQGLQLYTVVSWDFVFETRSTRNFLDKFNILRGLSNDEVAFSTLSPLSRRMLRAMVSFFRYCKTERSLFHSARLPGIAMIWRIFLFQEIHQPCSVSSLKRISTIAVALCLNNMEGITTLGLPTRLCSEVTDICSRIIP